MTRRSQYVLAADRAKMLFAENLKRELTASGMTQEEFAAKLGVTQGMVSSMISGRISPSFMNLIIIHEIFDLPHGELIRE